MSRHLIHVVVEFPGIPEVNSGSKQYTLREIGEHIEATVQQEYGQGSGWGTVAGEAILDVMVVTP
jgi:hypothetical protein